MKLSVVIPVCNVREYLRACVDSLNASIGVACCERDVEAVMVDDGSTDGSAELMDEMAARYSWIRVFHQQNRGVAAARNFALGEVAGEYLTWVDPDDLVVSDYFRAIFKALAARPDAVVFDYSNLPGGERHYRSNSGSLDGITVWRDVVRDERIKSFLCCKVFRRDLVPNPLFDESCELMSDFEAMGRLFRRVKTVEYIHDPIYVYRQRVGSIVNQPVPERMLTMFRLALGRLDEVDESCRDAALSCAMYHAYHYCHMAAKYPVADWNNGEALDSCRRYIRSHLKSGLMDQGNGWVRRLQFLLVTLGLMRVAVIVRRLLPGGRA